MTKREVFLLKKYLSPTDTLLEWGSGGSTIYLSEYCERIVSVEHDPSWYRRVKKYLPENAEILFRPPEKKIKIRHGTHTFDQFKEYVLAPHSLGIKFDKVLIDGRARTACAEKILPFIKEGGLVFFHDYFPRIKAYRTVERFLSLIDSEKRGQSLAIFSVKNRQE